jgi:hypothetical protein
MIHSFTERHLLLRRRTFVRSTSVENVLMVSEGKRNIMVKFVSLNTRGIVTNIVDTEISTSLVAVKVQTASFFILDYASFQLRINCVRKLTALSYI